MTEAAPDGPAGTPGRRIEIVPYDPRWPAEFTALIPDDAFRGPLEELDFRYRRDNPDLSKRYFREAPGSRRTHIHVRRAGSLDEQLNLVFRDHLRAHPDTARRYAHTKRELAARHRHDARTYTESKGSFIWDTLRRAASWSQETGWQPGPSDA